MDRNYFKATCSAANKSYLRIRAFEIRCKVKLLFTKRHLELFEGINKDIWRLYPMKFVSLKSEKLIFTQFAVGLVIMSRVEISVFSTRIPEYNCFFCFQANRRIDKLLVKWYHIHYLYGLVVASDINYLYLSITVLLKKIIDKIYI